MDNHHKSMVYDICARRDDKLSNFFLFQSISMAVQKGNAVCVMGCPKNTSSGLEFLFNFQVYEVEVL